MQQCNAMSFHAMRRQASQCFRTPHQKPQGSITIYSGQFLELPIIVGIVTHQQSHQPAAPLQQAACLRPTSRRASASCDI